ncbi:hypothetical protein [Oceanobacillus arenosus]|uniref:hypothetical protein n=1 Tax=Oceanobacillus arenosus TaxID=1229153 RepID=UPI001473EC8B|nr:hypothetical protein [Oceanobacillus arenosus]
MQRWNIKNSNDESIILLSDINEVAKYERELRDKGIDYKTDYYEGNKLITFEDINCGK